jgi:hypothetical protein
VLPQQLLALLVQQAQPVQEVLPEQPVQLALLVQWPDLLVHKVQLVLLVLVAMSVQRAHKDLPAQPVHKVIKELLDLQVRKV